jgi:hypothetical protein
MTKKYFQKSIDKRVTLWYNYYRKREGKKNKNLKKIKKVFKNPLTNG